MTMPRCRQLHYDWKILLIQLLVILQLQVRATIPNAEVWIETTASDSTPGVVLPFASPLLVTYGLFGDTSGTVAGPLAFPPDGDDLLCNEANGLVNYQTNHTVTLPSATLSRSRGRRRLNKFTTTTTTHTNSKNSTTNNTPSTIIPSANFSLPLYRHQEVLLVPRGNCSFERKTLSAQRLGASGILIYNTLQSRYGWNDTIQRVIYPEAKNDYECANGQDGNISASLLHLDPPRYNATLDNPLLTLSSPNNICHFAPSSSTCASQRCLVTGPASSNDSTFTACCAWDISETMNDDTTLSNTTEPIHIPAVFLTMAQGDALMVFLSSSSSTKSTTTTTTISIQPRTYPKWNASFFLLWLVGSFTVALASWNSAHEYRYTMLKLRQVRQRRERQARREPSNNGPDTEVRGGGEPTQEEDSSASERDLDVTTTTATPCPQPTLSSNSEEPAVPPSTRVAPLAEPPSSINPQDDGTTLEEEESPDQPAEAAPAANHNSWSSSMAGMFQGSPLESMEIEIWHVAIFLVVASTLLFLLFFFKFYRFVVVLYAFGCAGAVSLMVIRPTLERLELLCLQGIMSVTNNNSNNNDGDNNNNDTDDNRNAKPTFLHRLVLGDMLGVTWLDIFSAVGGYFWSAVWLFVYFTQPDPSEIAFYWVSQDVFGVALCVLILSLIKLNSMRIGTVLLVAVFFYDIFFVFLTPYLFNGKSIMVSVATSGGAPAGTADFCEKYPRDHSCRGGNPLPFLFTIPHINDYRGGSSLLGLGDVVLPGVLLSFAARLDEARRLLNRHTTLRLTEAPERWYQGYFPALIVAYLFGLLMANCAVVWMQRGQPALLYLVPSCLGTMVVLGRNESKDLWKGPKHLRWADRLVRYVLRRV